MAKRNIKKPIKEILVGRGLISVQRLDEGKLAPVETIRETIAGAMSASSRKAISKV